MSEHALRSIFRLARVNYSLTRLLFFFFVVSVPALTSTQVSSFPILPAESAKASASYTNTTANGPTFGRPGQDCQNPLSGAFRYHVQNFSVSQTGAYTISSEQVAFDGYILIYNGSFSPTSPTQNCVGGNDDDTTTRNSRVVLNLDANLNYVLVTTGFSVSDFGDFTNTVSGPGAVTIAGQAPAAGAKNVLETDAYPRFLAPSEVLIAVEDHFGGIIYSSLGTPTNWLDIFSAPKVIRRVSAAGELDTSFQVETSDLFQLGPDGKLYFPRGATVGGQAINGSVRLNVPEVFSAPTLDSSWQSPGGYGQLYFYPGHILAQGFRTAARLDYDGRVTASCTLPSTEFIIIEEWSQNEVLLDIILTDANGSQVHRLELMTVPGCVRRPLPTPGNLDLGFIDAVAADGDDVFVSTFLLTPQFTPILLKYSASAGTLDTDWSPPPIAPVFVIIDQAQVLTSRGSDTIDRYNRTTGESLHSPIAVPRSNFTRVRALPNRRLLVSGDFVDESTGNMSLLIKSFDGQDTGFRSRQTETASLWGGRFLPDGALVTIGGFAQVAGRNQYQLARLAPDRSLDTSWLPAISGFQGDQVTATQYDLRVAPVGSEVYAGGNLAGFRGIRVSTAGSVNTAFSERYSSPLVPLQNGNVLAHVRIDNPFSVSQDLVNPASNSSIASLPMVQSSQFAGCELNGFAYSQYSQGQVYSPRQVVYIGSLFRVRLAPFQIDSAWGFETRLAGTGGIDKIRCDNGELIVPGGIYSEDQQTIRAPARILTAGSGAIDPDFGAVNDGSGEESVVDYARLGTREVIVLYLPDDRIDFREAQSGRPVGPSLLPNGTEVRGNHRQLLLRDREINAFGLYEVRQGDRSGTTNVLRLTERPRLRLVSTGLNGLAAGGSAAIAGEGGLYVFESSSEGIWERPDTGDRRDVYLRDELGSFTEIVSQLGDRDANGQASFSADGRSIAFTSTSGAAAVKGGVHKGDAVSQIFMRDRTSGATGLVSSGPTGAIANGSSQNPRIARDAAVIVFDSLATNLRAQPDQNGVADVYLRDLATGQVNLVSVTDAGQPFNGASEKAATTSGGRFVVFESLATNVPGEGQSGIRNILIAQPLARSARVVSVGVGGQPANGNSFNPQVSESGRFVVFDSEASNLVGTGDTNNVSDVFLAELSDSPRSITITLVSQRGTQPGNGPSRKPSISADGRFVTFETSATNLFDGDSNGKIDVIVRDLLTGTIELVSKSDLGLQANGDSGNASISSDAEVITFESAANNLLLHDVDTRTDVYSVLNPLLTVANNLRNYSYTYWNPNEPGWGYNLQHQGNLLYGTWYTYAEDGQTMFLTVEGSEQADGSFAGPVYRVSGTPFGSINGSQAFTAITEIGTAQMSFAGNGALTLSYSVNGVSQTKQLERFIFDSGAPSCVGTTASRADASNYSDLWWNDAEAGWGLTLAHQGDTIFALWYTYGSGGRDQWISASSLTRQTDGSYSGALQRPSSGTPLAQIGGPATGFPVPTVGSATLRFSDGETGIFSYTLDGVSQSKAIRRFVVVGAGEAKPLCVQ